MLDLNSANVDGSAVQREEGQGRLLEQIVTVLVKDFVLIHEHDQLAPCHDPTKVVPAVDLQPRRRNRDHAGSLGAVRSGAIDMQHIGVRFPIENQSAVECLDPDVRAVGAGAEGNLQRTPVLVTRNQLGSDPFFARNGGLFLNSNVRAVVLKSRQIKVALPGEVATLATGRVDRIDLGCGSECQLGIDGEPANLSTIAAAVLADFVQFCDLGFGQLPIPDAQQAGYALGRIGRVAIPSLLETAEQENEQAAVLALQAIREMEPSEAVEAVEPLRALLGDVPSAKVRAEAAIALARVAPVGAPIELLVDALDSEDEQPIIINKEIKRVK